MKTLLDLSLDMQVPIVNGLCFSRGSAGDLAALGAKLAASATDMAAMCEGDKESYTGEVLVFGFCRIPRAVWCVSLCVCLV